MSSESSMIVHVSHSANPPGKIDGFNFLWAYYVKGFDPSVHCQNCFKGQVAKNFNTITAQSGVDIELVRAREFPFIYICGVAAGPTELKGVRNVHLAMRYSPGASVEHETYTGYIIRVTNAELLPIPELRENWNGLPDSHRRCKNFQFGVAYFPDSVSELQRATDVMDPELWRVQELFRGAVLSRVREGNLSVPNYLPRLSRNMLREKEPRWFPVPGMYGGFAYRMEQRGSELTLIAESWCRVADGSGMRHRITAKQVLLEEEGFV